MTRQMTGASSSGESHKPLKPLGFILAPGLLCSLAGFALAVTLHYLGFYKSFDEVIVQRLADLRLTSDGAHQLHVSYVMVVSLLVSFGISYASLGSAYLWRRMVLFLGGGALLFGTLISVALWNVIIPFSMVGVSFIWSWFCVVLYAGQHTMPSELADITEVMDTAGMDEDLVHDRPKVKSAEDENDEEVSHEKTQIKKTQTEKAPDDETPLKPGVIIPMQEVLRKRKKVEDQKQAETVIDKDQVYAPKPQKTASEASSTDGIS